DDHSQQWKIVSHPAASESGQVDFVNRATGRTIGTQTVYNDRFYYLQAITGAPAGEGWQIRSLNNGLYEIASGASTAAWYWNAAAGDESPHVYSGSPDKEQGFAWQFSLVEEFIPGLRQPEMPAGVRISVQDRVIRVEGVASYTIINIYGMHMPTHQPLPAGVYLVNIPDKTIKVLVK
ncbi:MAG: hypothetical protein LBB64_06345, partial [Dysgonamonadaceae bacterium]|nr:hypothetical protein [Dysgonamonadaceae bacterium]